MTTSPIRLFHIFACFVFCIGILFALPVSANGDKKLGEACHSNSDCYSGQCGDGICMCDDKNQAQSDHCAHTYGGPQAWRCIDKSNDPIKNNTSQAIHRGEWHFCVRSDHTGSPPYPSASTETVKYPVERKAYMGEACDDNDFCLTTSCMLESRSTVVSTPQNDPWYKPGRNLRVCQCYRPSTPPGPTSVFAESVFAQLLNTRCTAQYGHQGQWKGSCGTVAPGQNSDIEGYTVCERNDGWMPVTLEEMGKRVGPTQGSGNDGNTISMFGINATISDIPIIKPTPRISIPGVAFSDLDKESAIVTDTAGASWFVVPFLGEYIAAIYRYSVILITLIAIISLIVAGVQWIVSGGSSDMITKAKKRIISSLVAIVLTAGSYTILFAINPELVNFRNLRILVVRGIPFVSTSVVDAESYKQVTGQELRLDQGSRSENVRLAVEAAKRLDLDPCFAYVIVQHESRGNPAAVGHDEDYPLGNSVPARYAFLQSGEKFSGASFNTSSINLPATYNSYQALSPEQRRVVNSVEIFNDDGDPSNRKRIVLGAPPDYGIDWRFSHGLGLGQVTLTGNNYCTDVNGNRIRGYSPMANRNKCFGIPELLTPEGGVDAMMYRLLHWYNEAKKKVGYTGPNNNVPIPTQAPSRNSNDVVVWTFAMYGAGRGGGQLPRNSNTARVNHFKTCKEKGIQLSVPANSDPTYLESSSSEDEK